MTLINYKDVHIRIRFVTVLIKLGIISEGNVRVGPNKILIIGKKKC